MVAHTTNSKNDAKKAAQNPRCEYETDPLGIDTPIPRFSWTIDGGTRGERQSAYRLIVSSSEADLESRIGDLWDSGVVASSQTVNIEYKGAKLVSRTKYYWSVMYHSGDEEKSPWSETAVFETGFLDSSEWEASWIRGKNLFRKEFFLDEAIASARVYVSGLGYYELRINGKKIGERVLDPAWTDFSKKVFYSTYDVEENLVQGANAFAVMLGNGRYSPYDSTCGKSWHPLRKFGESPVLILQAHVKYVDGREAVIVSDSSWKTTSGPLTMDDLYDGETYDARLERDGWDRPGFDGSLWSEAVLVAEAMGRLVSQTGFPPIKVIRTMQSVGVKNVAPNVYVYDFGQNFSGWVRLRVEGPEGTEVKLRFAELSNEDGSLDPSTNRNAKATDRYILKGSGIEEYEPRFTYHGFRFVEMTGFPGTPSLDSIEAKVVHTAVEITGGFSCSHPLINRIHSNYLWTQLSNFMSVPTDCSQRDERMGWVGDAQLSSEAAAYNFDVASFYTKFMDDIASSQKQSGSVAGVSPPYWECYPADPTYATACVEFPWIVSRYYDDRRILEKNFDAMCRWVAFLGTQAKDDIVSFGLFGDWCPPMHANPVETPFEITSTWFYAHDTLLVARMAERLGKMDKAGEYRALYERITASFNRAFLKNGRYSASRHSDAELAEKIKSWLDILPESEKEKIKRRYATLYSASSQTSNLLPLYLDMVPADSVDDVVQTLLQDVVHTRSNHVNTGVVGVKYLFDVLVKCGYQETAYKLATQTTFPSWGYQIREGATTLWERWEYLSDDKVFNSHSHPFQGSIDAWFYKYLAGINLDEAGYGFERILIRPLVVGDLRFARATLKTVRGTVSSSWALADGVFSLTVSVPGNCEAKICVPNLELENVSISEGGTPVWVNGRYIAGVEGISKADDEPGYVSFRVGSGNYSFVAAK